MGLTFYIHPDNITKLLPADTGAQLNPAELFVLYATARYKASYAGHSRYELAARDFQYPDTLPTPLKAMGKPPTKAEIDAAKASLIVGGYLNKAGAITPKGRNAAP